MFASGVATDQAAMATAISNFLIAAGWTQNIYLGDSAIRPDSFNLTRAAVNGTYTEGLGIGFGASANINTSDIQPGTGSYLLCSPFTNFNSSSAVKFYQQPGHPEAQQASNKYLIVAAPMPAASISYWMFTDTAGMNGVIVMQVTTGVFSYIGFGYVLDADRFGWPNANGGHYCYGSRQGVAVYDTGSFGSNNQGINCPSLPPGYMNSNTNYPTALIKAQLDTDSSPAFRSSNDPAVTDQVRRAVGLVAGWQGQNNGQMGDRLNLANGGGLPSTLHVWSRSRSSSSQNVITQPCIMAAYRTTTRWSPLCRLPLVRACVTQGVINEGAQFSVGSDTYRAFNSFAVQEID